MTDPTLSRSAAASPYGKCTEELKARVPYEIKEGFTRIAHDLGMSESELLRDLVTIRVLGIEVVRKIQEERLGVVAGIGHK